MLSGFETDSDSENSCRMVRTKRAIGRRDGAGRAGPNHLDQPLGTEVCATGPGPGKA
jgi:hypothetical protein